MVADGHDEGAWKRSYPIEKAWDDAFLAYAQNGEAVRPEQGYPVRLHLPGWGAGNHMKWVRHIEVTDAPFLTEAEAEDDDETPAERAKRMLASVRGAKSIITSPAYPNVVSPGYSLVKGVAWSGRGKITRVDITTDGGKTWEAATLTGPVFPKCQTRFAYRWNWDGREAMLMSRAKDDDAKARRLPRRSPWISPFRIRLNRRKQVRLDYQTKPSSRTSKIIESNLYEDHGAASSTGSIRARRREARQGSLARRGRRAIRSLRRGRSLRTSPGHGTHCDGELNPDRLGAHVMRRRRSTSPTASDAQCW